MGQLKSYSYLVVIIILGSCATVHKTKSSSISDQVHMDTSSTEHQYNRETVTEEKGNVPVITNADSAQVSGTMAAEDTSEYRQDVETDGVRLTTIIKPKVNNGKVTGYQVNSKAVAKPKTVNIPVDRKTTTKETGTDKQQTGITDTKKETVTTSTKQVSRMNLAGVGAIIGVVILFLLFLYFRTRK